MMEIGKIVNTFGIKGELKILSDSEFVEERFKVGKDLYLKDGELLKITGFRLHNGTILVRVNDKHDINEVEKYKNQVIYVKEKDLEALEEGYYLFQLEDLDVYVDGLKVGQVVEVLKPSQTVLRIKLEDREILLPFVDAFIESVDLDEKLVNIIIPEGL